MFAEKYLDCSVIENDVGIFEDTYSRLGNGFKNRKVYDRLERLAEDYPETSGKFNHYYECEIRPKSSITAKQTFLLDNTLSTFDRVRFEAYVYVFTDSKDFRYELIIDQWDDFGNLLLSSRCDTTDAKDPPIIRDGWTKIEKYFPRNSQKLKFIRVKQVFHYRNKEDSKLDAHYDTFAGSNRRIIFTGLNLTEILE